MGAPTPDLTGLTRAIRVAVNDSPNASRLGPMGSMVGAQVATDWHAEHDELHHAIRLFVDMRDLFDHLRYLTEP